MSDRYARIDADRRWLRMQALGSIAYDASRDLRIAAKQDWRYLLVPVDASTRRLYERMVRPDEPLTDVLGIVDGRQFYARCKDLRALWRADSRRVS